MKLIHVRDFYPNACGETKTLMVSDELYNVLMEEAKEWKRLKKQDRHIACSYVDGETDWNLRHMWVTVEDIRLLRKLKIVNKWPKYRSWRGNMKEQKG